VVYRIVPFSLTLNNQEFKARHYTPLTSLISTLRQWSTPWIGLHWLWKVLRSSGAPAFLIQLIENLHTGTTSRVRVGGQLSEPFEITCGVRQGCVLAPTLFCIAIDWILSSCAGIMGTTVSSSKFTDQDYADDAVRGRTSCQASMKLHIRWVWIPSGRKPRFRT